MWRMVEGHAHYPLSLSSASLALWDFSVAKENKITFTSIIQLIGQGYDFRQNPFPLVLPKSFKKFGKTKTLILFHID